MTLRQGLSVRQTQSLAMTPELRNAIEILAYGQQDILRFVEEQIEGNPLISLAEEDQTPTAPAEAEETDLGVETDVFLTAATPESADVVFDTGRENLRNGASVSDLPYAAEQFDPFATVSEQISLRDYLQRQVPLAAPSEPSARLMLGLIDMLDADGYIRTPLAEIAVDLGATKDELADALRALQSCEPTGVAARSLGERFALQLSEMGDLTEDKVAFLRQLDRATTGEAVNLKKEMATRGIDYDVMLSEIRQLDCDPCASFRSEHSVVVQPDIQVRRDNLGGWAVDLNPETLPKIIVDGSLSARISNDGKDVAFIRDCMNHGNWLQRALRQRAETILKVSVEIVKRQDRFFSEGVSAMEPMTLRDVADATGMHESTISRVTRSKYLECERGLFELRFFFSTALTDASTGSQTSSKAIRERVRLMIADEAAEKPLSDDKIAKLLKSEGIAVARRTVMKYREAMNIPSSVDRRRLNSGTVKLTSQ